MNQTSTVHGYLFVFHFCFLLNRKPDPYRLGEKLCKEAIQQTKPTVLWQPCLFLSASLGLKGLLRVALSYSHCPRPAKHSSQKGNKKKKEKRVQRTELAEVSWRLPRRELVLKSSLRSHLFCLSSCHITSCLEKEEGKSVLGKIINSERPHGPQDRFNQVSTLLDHVHPSTTWARVTGGVRNRWTSSRGCF